MQLAFARFLDSWAKTIDGKRGKVGPEWRLLAPPNSYDTASVVPDVAYLATYVDIAKADRTYPTIAPDITVEILSPDNKMSDVERKCRFYLWWGVRPCIIADPVKRIVEAHESIKPAVYYGETEPLTSRAFPTWKIPLYELFAELDEPT